MKNQDAPVRTKRAYDPPDGSDGAQLLVDRLWPRGPRKENAALTCWLKEIAPSPGLRQRFGHDPERYREFARRYRAELEGRQDAVAQLESLVKEGPVTLLYAAHDQECNHALVLAEYVRDRMARGDG
jgi:uncharacterized protein YeaO (DUF488 family)